MAHPKNVTAHRVTGLMPKRSISLPQIGLESADVTPAMASAAATCARDHPNSAATGFKNKPNVNPITTPLSTPQPMKLPTTTHQRFLSSPCMLSASHLAAQCPAAARQLLLC